MPALTPHAIKLDERVARAIDSGNKAATALQQKKNLKLRLHTMLMHAMGGGLFFITPELITFVDLLVRRGDDAAVLQDSRENPIRVANLPAFLDTIVESYHEAYNEYYLGWSVLRRARTIEALTDLKKESDEH